MWGGIHGWLLLGVVMGWKLAHGDNSGRGRPREPSPNSTSSSPGCFVSRQPDNNRWGGERSGRSGRRLGRPVNIVATSQATSVSAPAPERAGGSGWSGPGPTPTTQTANSTPPSSAPRQPAPTSTTAPATAPTSSSEPPTPPPATTAQDASPQPEPPATPGTPTPSRELFNHLFIGMATRTEQDLQGRNQHHHLRLRRTRPHPNPHTHHRKRHHLHLHLHQPKPLHNNWHRKPRRLCLEHGSTLRPTTSKRHPLPESLDRTPTWPES